MNYLRSIIILFSIFLFTNTSFSAVIRDIAITGNQRIDSQTILEKINSKVGSKLKLTTVDKDIKNIFKLGYFKRITASETDEKNGVKLIYKIFEKPSIRNILFSGNDHIKDKQLLKIIDAKPYQIVSREKIKDSVNQIISFYASKQRFSTHVQSKLKPVKNNRVDLIFNITEGRKTYIKAVKIFGNKHIKYSDIIDVMTNRPKYGAYLLTWLPWFYTGRFNPSALPSDRGTITDLYLSRGYAKIKVKPIKIFVDPIDGKIMLQIIINEGEQYKIGKISFSDHSTLNKTVLKSLASGVGKIFNGVALRNDVSKLVDLYGQKGYAYADINPQISFDDTKKLVNIHFAINKGKKVKIARVTIGGDSKTEDKVIRREMKIVEGDFYNPKKIRRSRRNIINTNFFANVKIRQVPGIKRDKMKLSVQVKEKSTGSASIGAGYSTYDKALLKASLSEANFMGTGIHASVSGSLSSKTKQFDIDIVQPWWHNMPISVELHLFNIKSTLIDYDDKNYGASLTVTKRYGDYYKLGASYGFNVDKIKIITDNPSTTLLDNAGTFVKSAITPFAGHDSRNIYLYPTKGNKEDLSVEFAGIGGNMRFIKPAFDARFYQKLSNTFVLMEKIKGTAVSAIGKKVPLSELFYMGGIDDFRGATFSQISPRDKNGDLIGGTKKAIGSIELHFPLISALKLYGKLFYDVGDVWGNGTKLSLKQAVGPGITWFSPIGPIDVAIGKDISPKKNQPSSAFNFSFGTTF